MNNKQMNAIAKIKRDLYVNSREVIDDYIMLNKEDLIIVLEYLDQLIYENTNKTSFIGSNDLIKDYMKWLKQS